MSIHLHGTKFSNKILLPRKIHDLRQFPSTSNKFKNFDMILNDQLDYLLKLIVRVSFNQCLLLTKKTCNIDDTHAETTTSPNVCNILPYIRLFNQFER